MKPLTRLLSLSMYVLCPLTLAAQNSPYINRVYEYLPAPGQFVNTMPAYEEGDDAEAMCRKVEEQIAGNARGMITLGGWGGYVVFGFDHPVVNVAGEYDFIVEGNAFYSNPSVGAESGGSCEPGIIMVSADANGNGKPDDEWYEIAGSEYNSPATLHGYEVNYQRPDEGHQPTPDPNHKYRTDTTYIRWTDNMGVAGYLEQLSYHKQAYYPEWIASNTLTFTGARLADNYAYVNNQYVLYPYAYGYADNHPDSASDAQLNIEWAVRADGTPAELKAIDFVKVYTALHQQCGSIGETSTEVMGARDLHPDAGEQTAVSTQRSAVSSRRKVLHDGQLLIIRNNQAYTPLGQILTKY